MTGCRMAAIEIRLDYLRIARAWTLGATGEPLSRPVQCEALRHILIEPGETGGVTIVASDGGAMCVQTDHLAHTDGAYLIEGLTKANVDIAKDRPISDLWLKVDDGVASVHGVPLHHVKVHRIANGISTYPDWRKAVPSDEEIRSMQHGFPGYVSVPYMAVIGRLWDGYLSNCRTVHVLSHGSLSKPTVMRFLWRPEMLVVIAPHMNENGMPGSYDLFGLSGEQMADTVIDDDDDL